MKRKEGAVSVQLTLVLIVFISMSMYFPWSLGAVRLYFMLINVAYFLHTKKQAFLFCRQFFLSTSLDHVNEVA